MIIEDALKLGACDKVKSATDLESLVELFFSPQGREFCLKNNFPSLETFRGIDAEKYGVFTEKDVYLKNQNVALINCTGKLIFNKTDGYKVILMHGSKVEIEVSNYAVVLIEGEGAIVKKDKTSKVL